MDVIVGLLFLLSLSIFPLLLVYWLFLPKKPFRQQVGILIGTFIVTFVAMVLIMGYLLSSYSGPPPAAMTEPSVKETQTRMPMAQPPTHTPTATETPVVGAEPPTHTPVATETSTPTPTALFLETTEDTEISRIDIPGQIEIEYPVRMSPGSSNTVSVLISALVEIASLEFVDFFRVTTPPSARPVIGKIDIYRTNLLIADTMRVELQSPTFEVTSLQSSTQPVSIHASDERTRWLWTVKAPTTIGAHVLTVSVYRGNEIKASLVRSLQVEVLEFTPTPPPPPVPTATTPPGPLIDRPGVVAIIGAIGLIMAAIIGLIGTLAIKGLLPLNFGSRKENLKREIAKLERRLQGLREKKAVTGISADPSLDIEIEEIEQRLDELRTELNHLESKDAPASPEDEV